MKKLGFFLCLACLSLTVFANPYQLRRMELSFFGGATFPLGKMTQLGLMNYDPETKSIGLNGAKLGYNYGLSINFYVWEDLLGITLIFNGMGLKCENVVFSGNNFDFRNWQTTYTDDWTSFFARAGLTFRYPIHERFHISTQLSIGYAHLLSPYYRAELEESPRLKLSREIHSNSSPSFGMGAGVGLKFLITPGFHLNLTGDYLTAIPFRFKSIESTLTASVPNKKDVLQSQINYNTKQNFSVINLSLGFTFAF